MKDITELERRITAALDRIGAGVEGLSRSAPAPAPSDDEGQTTAVLQAELEAERETTAQLEERVRAIQERQDTRVVQLEAELAAAMERLDRVEADRRRIKRVNDELRGSNQALREANEAGLADAALVDQAMRTELDALRAMRDSDRAEMEEILADLAPALDEGETANA
ncbi:hypothetical protein [Tranquillimonas alkanivorans]|uniref:Uncharacterized protein n=1 Tax=Tranquillimonas alkanivorans TaxID=441119 RepID=A0A1I5P1J5_9RHOB|nr:hypothetical protein [Tranquillimonas alkanivorans]SFP27883.1 hypothetical protein SAMN04488047_104190 [Tranquillimonas alkanivorans]